MIRIVSFLLWLVFLNSGSNNLLAQDYIEYHQKIILAEDEIFLKNNVPKGLDIYAAVFKKYNFVFLRDCITAMQISLYQNDEKSFLNFTEKAAKNGLMLRHFKRLKYITTHPIYIKDRDVITRCIEKNRSYYLKRIDTTTLKKMIRLYVYDQMDKMRLPTESSKQYDIRYKPLIQETTRNLMEIIRNIGFPSDKLIGIDQNDIMKELLVGNCDAMDYYNKHKKDPDFHAAPLQFDLEEYHFSSKLYFPIIIHYSNFWKDPADRRRYLLHSDEFYLQQIAAGNIHPQEAACLYDLGFNFVATPKPDTAKGEKYFGIQLIFSTEDRPDNLRDAEMNRFRASFYISSIQCKRAKIAFMRKQGMRYSFGWEGCRS